jgi:membrane protein YdbS with pleckstrin-like domain
MVDEGTTTPAPTAPAAPETKVWEGTPSQWTKFGTYFLSVLVLAVLGAGAGYLRWGTPGFLGSWSRPIGLGVAVLMVVPLFCILRAYILTRTTKYSLTTERILSTIGVFSRRTDNLELYRVDDLKVEQPFFMRLVGRSNIVIVTSDRTTAELTLAGLPNANALRDDIRKHVEACRDRKRTRVVDMDHF